MDKFVKKSDKKKIYFFATIKKKFVEFLQNILARTGTLDLPPPKNALTGSFKGEMSYLWTQAGNVLGRANKCGE